MRFEHIAINVADARKVVDWYVKNLDLVVMRQMSEAPYTTFLTDKDHNMMFEFYQQPVAVADLGGIAPFSFHIAFLVDDMDAWRNRWIDAGGTAEGDVATTPAGDKLAFVRDPWGLTLQLVMRKEAML
jgi:catechol 2,3-dioxygenase-like lactoylglutathione lyase family enzyme